MAVGCGQWYVGDIKVTFIVGAKSNLGGLFFQALLSESAGALADSSTVMEERRAAISKFAICPAVEKRPKRSSPTLRK